MHQIAFALLVFAAAATASSSAFAQRSIGFAAEARDGDGLIVAVSDPDALSAISEQFSGDGGANIERALAAASFEAGPGEILSLVTGEAEHPEVHLIGVGPDAMAARDWADFGGRVGSIARTSSAARLAVLAPGAGAGDMISAAEGALLGAYSFDLYKSEPAPQSDGDLVMIVAEPGDARARFNGEARHRAEAVNWVRDMQSEPANTIYPESFVSRARDAFKGVEGVSIRVLDVRAMERLGMGAILGVGKGSERPPRMMIIDYRGGEGAPIVFAGKGITFDTGGISLKSNSGMWKMKYDMSGAAAVTGAVLSLARSRAPVNVIAIAALAENMPDGGAQRPGDVVRAMSGKTIELMSTDAEGRLVLADAVWYAQEEYDPALLVDIATLTGSVGRALGDEYAGLFARDDAIAARLEGAGDASGEDLWRLPLHPNHDQQIMSVIADVKNGDTGSPGASTGAAFIGAFVRPETPWAHLDIAGVAWREEATPTAPVGASGFGVRLLDQLARDRAEDGDQ